MKKYLPDKTIFDELHFIIESQLQSEILEIATILKVPKNETIIRHGQYLDALPIVLKGTIRVFQQTEDKEILLYYVQRSNTCMMSLSACFFNTPSQSIAVTEEDTTILNIPSNKIYEWQKKYSSWNTFILHTFKYRYDELLESFESVAFDNMDQRVIKYLKHYSEEHQTNLIPLSHNKLANEMGTTRVVISRILKKIENENKIVLKRKAIKLL